MGIAKRRLPLNVAPCCGWILHRSCVDKSWRDNARMWAKHPRWIFFQMTLSFRVLIGISCFFFQHKTYFVKWLLRINMQNTCNSPKYKKQKNGKRCARLEERGGWRWSASSVSATEPLFHLSWRCCFTPMWNWFSMSPLWSSPTRGLKNREGRTGHVFRRPLLWMWR